MLRRRFEQFQDTQSKCQKKFIPVCVNVCEDSIQRGESRQGVDVVPRPSLDG